MGPSTLVELFILYFHPTKSAFPANYMSSYFAVLA